MPSRVVRLVRRTIRYWQTLRHLRPVQVVNRIWRRIYRARPDTSPPPPTREDTGTYLQPPRRPPRMEGPTCFTFMNEEGRVDGPGDWNASEKSELWLYHLHSFDDLVARKASERREWHVALVRRWIDENPPGTGVGWDPHPTSLRIVNWIKWGFEWEKGTLPAPVRHSLAVQARWLRRRLEYHLLGNHLMANAKALCFAGLFFAGDEAAGWYDQGRELVERELPEQVLEDGGHFERSPMYHAIVLEDLLDLVNVHRRYGRDFPRCEEAAASMASWLRVMRHPDGQIPFFNDASLGQALPPARLDDYAKRLDIPEPSRREAVERPVHDLADTGYLRLEAGPIVAFLDIAPVGPDYLPAHAHADSLSFELSLGDRRLFVNCGTSVYEEGPRRRRERGTAAHNTVVLDGENSSETWDAFRMARRARITERKVVGSGKPVRVVGAHDGYRRLEGSPLHRRMWSADDRELSVLDRVEGEGRHDVSVWLHLHPSWSAFPVSESVTRIEDRIDGEAGCEVRFEGAGRMEIRECTYAPEFGRVEPSDALRYCVEDATLPVEIRTLITWCRGEEGDA